MNYQKVDDASINIQEESQSDCNTERQNTTESLLSVDRTPKNSFIQQYKNYFLVAASLIMIGGYYNCLFQGFIKNQFLESMNFSNNQYSTIVTVPHFPNIIVPILIGPLVDIIGIRRGTFICSFVMFIGFFFIVISIIPKSFALILIGKILHQVGTENTHLCQSTIVSKWFKSSNLALALAICSFTIKLSSSLSGIGYPYLYEKNNSLLLPLMVGFGFVILSLIATVIIIVMDKKSEQYDCPCIIEENMVIISKKHKFQLKDIKQFDGLFWLICLQIFMVWGSFYSFQNYGQSVLINKFQFEQTEASSSLSILFFVGMSSPLFGFISDKYGNRAHVMVVLSVMCVFSFLLVLVAPSRNEDMKPIVYIFLILFGTAISIGNAYIFPSIPLIVDPNYLGTAFGISYAAKNAGTFTYSLIGGFALGENDQHFNHLLFFLFTTLICLVIVSIITYTYDKKKRDVLSPPKIFTNKKIKDISTQQLI
ncbi:hypothetical protein ABPG74_015980 [Tetrahymena malaccensis]